MRYEVRVGGESIGVFAEPKAALAAVRAALLENRGQEPEIIDMQTGKMFAAAEMEPEGDAIAEER